METVRIICKDKELGRKVFAQLTLDGIPASLIEEEVDVAYLDAKDELEAKKILAITMTELYLENTFLIGQFNHLSNRLNLLNQALVKKPMDIRITSEIKKISNDLEILEPAMGAVNAVIFKHIEKKFAKSEQKFLYCKTE